MFTLGFMAMFFVAFGEGLNLRRMANNKPIKNLLATVQCFIVLITCSSIYSMNVGFNNIDVSLFSDWRFYLGAVFEMLSFIIARINYDVNRGNMVAINMAVFMSLPIIIIITYFLSPILGFDNTIMLNYQDISEMWLFVIISTVLCLLFFYGKVNNEIKSLPLIIINPLSLSVTLFISTKLMQTYDSYLVFGSFGIILFTTFITATIYKKEYKQVKKEHHKDLAMTIVVAAIITMANVAAVKILATEFISLVKRLSQIISGYILDVMNGKKLPLSKIDILIITLLFITGLSYYLARS